jgi:transcription elongation factor Elf1
MECPVCGSSAVVALFCLEKVVEQVQDGRDPYDLMFNDQTQAECRACGARFNALSGGSGPE